MFIWRVIEWEGYKTGCTASLCSIFLGDKTLRSYPIVGQLKNINIENQSMQLVSTRFPSEIPFT